MAVGTELLCLLEELTTAWSPVRLGPGELELDWAIFLHRDSWLKCCPLRVESHFKVTSECTATMDRHTLACVTIS